MAITILSMKKFYNLGSRSIDIFFFQINLNELIDFRESEIINNTVHNYLRLWEVFLSFSQRTHAVKPITLFF